MSANPPSPSRSPKRQRLEEPEEEVNVGAGTSRQRPEAPEGSRSSDESLEQNSSESTSSSGISSILSFAPELEEEAAGEECAVDADVLAAFRQRKVTRCILENAVNRIVESYQFFVRPEDFLAPSGNDGLEDAAILMAISEHGLAPSNVAPAGVAPAPPCNPTSVSEKEHLDFMEAAVAVAIQKKGLTPLSLPLSPHR